MLHFKIAQWLHGLHYNLATSHQCEHIKGAVCIHGTLMLTEKENHIVQLQCILVVCRQCWHLFDQRNHHK